MRPDDGPGGLAPGPSARQGVNRTRGAAFSPPRCREARFRCGAGDGTVDGDDRSPARSLARSARRPLRRSARVHRRDRRRAAPRARRRVPRAPARRRARSARARGRDRARRAALVAVVAFPRLRPGLRATVALGLGVPALVNGAMHVVHISVDGPQHSDLTGVLALVAPALVLIGLGAIPWRRRGETPRPSAALDDPPRRASGRRGVALLVVVPIAMAVFETHKPRERIGAPPNAAYEHDRVRLDRRPAPQGLVPPVAQRRDDPRHPRWRRRPQRRRRHARMLERHGYGVLALRRPRPRRERRQPQLLRLGLGEGRCRRAGLPARPHGRRPRPASARSASPAARDAVIDVAATRDDVAPVVADGAAAARTTTGRACAAPISARSRAG